jgi:hypothetical protein
MTSRTVSACWGAAAALLAIGVNVVVLLAEPFLRPDLGVWNYALSYYAVGPWGSVQDAGFAAMGVASIALAVSLSQSGLPTPWRKISSGCLLVAGLASCGLVWFPMGSVGPITVLGDAHQTAGTVGGVAQLAAALAFILAARAQPAWSGLFVVSLVVFALALVGAVATQIAIWRPELGLPMGAAMRLVVVSLLLLWGIVAWQLRRLYCGPASRSCGAR